MSHYEINVSLNGHHYFATAERSITSEARARQAVQDFRTRFPESEGFKVDCTYIRCTGTTQNF